MSTALRRPMTIAEFLDWEEAQEIRWEFDGSGPVAMTGGTFAHALVQANLTAAMVTRLRGTPCRFVGEVVKLRLGGSVRYPDGMVVCTPKAARDTSVDDPVVIFEILSPSTASTDRTVKAREYMRTPSVQRYVMLEQDGAAATMHARDGDRWTVTLLLAGDTLVLPELAIDLPLDELYEGVAFPAPEAGETQP